MRNRDQPPLRLAVVVSHPIQYYAPWFVYLTAHLRAELRVFYLWDFGVTRQIDRDFGCAVQWDVDLLAGYDYCFVPNVSRDPGTHHFGGLNNPTLVEELTKWKPDKVLLFGYKYRSHWRVLTSPRLWKFPIIFRGDSHLLAENRSVFRRVAKRLLLPLIFRRFGACLSVGQAHDAYLRAAGVPKEKIFWAPHALDNRRFLSANVQADQEARVWRRKLGIPADHRVILFAGKFERKKCPDDLVRAFLVAKLATTTLLLVGHGEMEAELRRLAMGRADICFAPFQNQSAMPRTYAAADLVVLPSFGPGESWGLVINEAMCCGKAVVASTDVGCQVDLVRHRDNGLVFRAGDMAALAAALSEAMSDLPRLKRWGDEGRRIIAGYSYAAATAGLQAALASLPIRTTK